MKKLFITFTLSLSALISTAKTGPYDAVVAADGSGDYRSVSEDCNAAAPEGRTAPWLILVKKGDYREHVVVPENPNLISTSSVRTSPTLPYA